MTSEEFVIWLKGFVEACNDFHPTPKQWDKIKEVLESLDKKTNNISTTAPSSITFSVTSGSIGAATTQTIWNDKMGSWHYTNYPDGFGYYHNGQDKKELLND